ncbi:hypothetical protein KKH82_07785 [Patescibacteria group bacterium]|nr:hypothetical protein [Patescibacteria group bacterium]
MGQLSACNVVPHQPSPQLEIAIVNDDNVRMLLVFPNQSVIVMVQSLYVH